MVFLLSYAHMAIASSGNMQVHSKVESSVRKLFTELAKSQRGSMLSVSTVQKQLPESYVRVPRSFRNNIEMKKGHWICTRCSLMNFVNNKQSLQCDDHWPKKFLTGGEWECPQCNFCNFSKNVVCLRCDYKKPGVNQFLGPTPDLGLNADKSFVKDDSKKIKAGTEHEQQWFTKIAELENSSDTSSALAHEDLNETMKTGDNSFAASSRNSDIDRDQFNRRTNGDENSINVNINQSLEELIGQKTSPYESIKGGVGKSKASSFPGMSSSASQLEQHNEPKAVLNTDAPVHQQMSSEKSSSQLENKFYKRDQAGKAERWSTKVEKLHEVKGLPNAVSDDDFPEIMPMREGENQFVVSKKKDRSLTSPIYKRRVAKEQERENNYVPFVPFPPGYFAKENSQEGSESTHSDEQTGAMGSGSGGVGERKEGESSSPILEASNNMNENPVTFDLQYNTHDDHSKSPGTSENARVKASWGERSLEGSAVKEINPLDMSEEAKAERWFRRVAQIKDISELSQIPDEDFPSIMPMRKGVNRFVVSKRKTPLERRLTSPHYRRNLPVTGSGPIKKETDSD